MASKDNFVHSRWHFFLVAKTLGFHQFSYKAAQGPGSKDCRSLGDRSLSEFLDRKLVNWIIAVSLELVTVTDGCLLAQTNLSYWILECFRCFSLSAVQALLHENKALKEAWLKIPMAQSLRASQSYPPQLFLQMEVHKYGFVWVCLFIGTNPNKWSPSLII